MHARAMRRSRLPLLISLCAAHCNGALPAGDAPHAWQAGSRLRPTVYDFGGGHVDFADWYDSRLDTHCMFQLAEDGAYRCLPITPATQKSYRSTVPLAYADAACSKPLAHLPDDDIGCNHGGEYVTSDVVRMTGCPLPTEQKVWKLGASKAYDLGTVYALAGGKCTPGLGSPPGTVLALYDAEPVDPGAFVRGTTRTVAVGSELQKTVVDGEDGSRNDDWTVGPLMVAKTQAPCILGGGAGENDNGIHTPQPVCVPVADPVFAEYTNYYADPDCAQPLVAWTAQCPVPTLGFVVDDPTTPGCSTISLHSIGAPVTPTKVYGPGCGANVPQAPNPNLSYASVGGPLDTSAAVPLTEVSTDLGMLIEIGVQSASGAHVANNGLRIRASARGCWPVAIGSRDNVRCVPLDIGQIGRPPPHVRLFSDPACSREVVAAHPAMPDCDEMAGPTLLGRASASCGVSYEALYQGGPQMTLTTWYSDEGAKRCTKQTGSQAFVEAGAPADDSMAPPIAVRVQ